MSTEATLMTDGQGSTETAGQQSSTEAVAPETTAAPQGEQQPAQDGQQEQSTAETEEAPQGAPEAYADFELPEGVTLSAAQDGEIKALAKEFNLPQDKAQKLAESLIKQARSAETAIQERFNQGKQDWINATRNDKEIGGDKLQSTIADVNRAIDKIGTPALRQLLVESGFGNHPEVIRLLAKAGKAVSEDAFVAGARGQGNAEKTLGQILYPNMK